MSRTGVSVNEYRSRRGFLFFPLTIQNPITKVDESRWLTFASWEEKQMSNNFFSWWKPYCWDRLESWQEYIRKNTKYNKKP